MIYNNNDTIVSAEEFLSNPLMYIESTAKRFGKPNLIITEGTGGSGEMVLFVGHETILKLVGK